MWKSKSWTGGTQAGTVRQELQLNPATSEQGRRGDRAPHLCVPAQCLAAGTQPTFSEWTFRVLKLQASSQRPRLAAGQQRKPRASVEGRCSDRGRVSASGSEFRGCPPPAHGTHPDALHHRDVLVLVGLEGDPAGAGGPAHGSRFCPRRVRAWTHEHGRTRAPRPRERFPGRSKATTPRSKEKAPVPKARLLRSRARSRTPRVGPRSKPPASYRKVLQDWWTRTRMLWQQVCA